MDKLSDLEKKIAAALLRDVRPLLLYEFGTTDPQLTKEAIDGMRARIELGTECFIIAAPRSDASLPKPCKAMYENLYFDKEDAMNTCNVAVAAGSRLGVFRCNISVVDRVT